MIRAVVFDWGGVIQRTIDPGPRLRLAQELGQSREAMERGVFESEIWRRASIGLCGADETWETIVLGLGFPRDRVAEFVERFFAGDEIDGVLVALVRALRRQGMPVVLLSNAPPGRSRSASPAGRWGMAGLFNAQVFSYQVGVLKPAPRMYAAALEALSSLGLGELAPGDVVFIDDSPANVRGALQTGMDAIHFGGVEPLWAALAQRGLSLPCLQTLASRTEHSLGKAET